MAQDNFRPLTDEEILAVADQPDLVAKFTSEELRRLRGLAPDKLVAFIEAREQERTTEGARIAPMALGAAGGIIGGPVGAAAGGFVGEAAKQVVQRGHDDPGVPATAGGQLRDMLTSGAKEGALELGGRVVMGAASRLGRSLVDNAVRPAPNLAKEFPDVIDTVIRERIPVGRNVLPWTRSGSQQAKGLLRESARTTRGLLRQAGEEGVTFSPQQIAAKDIADLAQRIGNQPISGPDLRRLSAMTVTYLKEHGEAMTPQAVKDMKQAAQSLAKPVFRAQQAGGGVTADQALGARFNEAVASGAKTALETIAGIADSEARTQRLIGATRAVRQAEVRRLPLMAEGLSAASAVIGALLQPDSGLDDRVRNAALAYLTARGISSPRAMSRVGLSLTGPVIQGLLQQVPRLAYAVATELQAEEAPETR